MDVTTLTAHRCRELLAAGEVSAVELTRAYLDRIAATDGAVQAYLAVDAAGAVAAAAAVDAKPRGERLPWEGVPIGLKDVLCVKGMETTCGSRILKGYIPPYDATVIAKLRDAGLIFLGKLNMDEFAMGSSTENSAFQTTRNPWDLDRVPGGSSGGSAACVAASEAPWALGTDTGGSIRQPASLCGVVGLKPTYGAVSRYGLVAFASSLDQIGSLTRDVRDAAALLDLIAGRDPRDSTSIGLPEPVGEPGRTSLEGLRFGVIGELIGDACEPGVREVFDSAVDAIGTLGGVCEEVSLPSVERGIAAYYLIAPSEASSNLARFDGVRYGHRTAESEDLYEMYVRTRSEGFGAEVKRRIMIGTYALSAGYYDAYYAQAQRTRTLIIQDFARAFAAFDFLISPTSPSVAFKIGERTADPLSMYLSDLCTIPVNLAALPGISIPAGFSAGLPVGLQIIGPHFSERGMLGAAHALEHHLRVNVMPPLAAPEAAR
ncbi:MAG: aspartyl/glutamyl-tRNA amidotransferase subunit A [Actinobacteria bacterium RBG_16_64_13]|nr:MAG: aspartyl/glutamyl-tRNA amidotransferase subunit A [Actinobacteria bacterium RBG_16_64_13]